MRIPVNCTEEPLLFLCGREETLMKINPSDLRITPPNSIPFTQAWVEIPGAPRLPIIMKVYTKPAEVPDLDEWLIIPPSMRHYASVHLNDYNNLLVPAGKILTELGPVYTHLEFATTASEQYMAPRVNLN